MQPGKACADQPGARADDDPVSQAFVLRKSSLNEEEFNKYISHRLGPSAFGYYSGSNSVDGSYTAGRGNSMTNGASPCAPTLCPIGLCARPAAQRACRSYCMGMARLCPPASCCLFVSCALKCLQKYRRSAP